MFIAVAAHKISRHVKLFAPASRDGFVKWLQFLTAQAGGKEQACNTSDGEQLVAPSRTKRSSM